MSQSKLDNGKKRWQITVICLKKTTAVLQEHIKSKLTSALNSWPQQALNNFDEFISKVNEQVGYVYYERSIKGLRGTWKIQDNDVTNNLILSKILDLHTNPYFRNIQFQSNDSSMGSMPEPYWKLAKIFMPHGNNRSREPADSDFISFFDLLRNCRCFSGDFDRRSLDTVCI
jgi:hypothetical protein